nr:site-specific integrase [Jiangella mangrovi]
MAVEDGVLEVNAARQVRPAKAKEPRKTKHQIRRSLTPAERDALLSAVEGDEASQQRDLVDVVRFMLGTAVRVSEALAVEWADLDFDAGTVHIRGTKSEAADRELDLPGWLLDALRARRKERGVTKSDLVFPSLRDTLRDSVNVMHQLRDVLDRSGFEWVTSHTFRRTAATRLHDAGVPIVRAADQLGHADPSMTLRNYIGRRGDTKGNAEHL